MQTKYVNLFYYVCMEIYQTYRPRMEEHGKHFFLIKAVWLPVYSIITMYASVRHYTHQSDVF